jgi:hypothetical protein
MKWISIVGLLLAVFWRSSPNYQLLLQFVVSAGAVLVIFEAFREEKYLWVIGFVAITMLFNPFQPFEFSSAMLLLLDLSCVTAFAVSLAVLKPKPQPANSSIFVL